MRAWRTHEYGPPLHALHLDEVDLPQPGPGEVRVRVQAIPLNLNDLERITGGNMMVEPELPTARALGALASSVRAGTEPGPWLGGRGSAWPRKPNGGLAGKRGGPPCPPSD